MKNLTDKFDHLPQDFDREVIWEGIEKPKGLFFYHPLFWAAVASVVVAVVVLVAVPAPDARRESTPVKTKAAVLPKALEGNTTATLRLQHPTPTISFESRQEIELISPQTNERFVSLSGPANQAVATEEPAGPEMIKRKFTDNNDSNGSIEPETARPAAAADIETAGVVAVLPTSFYPVLSSTENTVSVAKEISVIKRNGREQRLSIRMGIGGHHSSFSSSDGGTALWRSLEKPQLDYGLGLHYEHLLRQKFFVAVTAGYQLFKDKLTTAYERSTSGQGLLVDYRLHNHYHVFTGQLELGKRFYQKGFFWDISGGAGFKFHQVSEVDFFIGADELASEALTSSNYQSASDLYFTAQSGIGKQLSSRLFVRMGAQVNSSLQLTANSAAIQHRIVPVSTFLEMGVRF